MYKKKMQEKLDKLKADDKLTILAIETSCDETAVAIIKGKKVLSNVISSQIDIHKRYGGVVPEIASRNHASAIKNVVQMALDEAKISLEKIDMIAVTYGSGLVGALLVGVSFAKGLSYAINKPLVPINHIRGHIAANYLQYDNVEFPCVVAIVSGGHTVLGIASSYTDLKIVGESIDDACGECIDKVSRVLGLGYPGGPNLEKLAQKGKINIKFPIAKIEDNFYAFSFSGLKTSAINYINNNKKKKGFKKEDVAASFQAAVFEPIIDKAIQLAVKNNIKEIFLSGGVSANKYLRELMTKEAKQHNIKINFPDVKLSTDNALMCALEARCLVKDKKARAAGFDLDAIAYLDVDNIYDTCNN